MRDFRNMLSWRNYLRAIKRGTDKDLINNFSSTANYINTLESQIVELSMKVDALEKELKNGGFISRK